MEASSQTQDWSQEQEKFLREIDPHWHFHRVFDNLPGIYFFVKNKRGETLFCSANLPFNHGFQFQDDIVGKTDHDLTPGPLAEKYLADDAKIYESGQPLAPQVEICIDHVGLPNWYRTCKYPIKNRQGEVIGIMGTFQLTTVDHTNDPRYERLEPARSMLAGNLKKFPGLAFLAKCCNLSVRQFQRVFKETFGTNPQDYWMKLRLRSACELIGASKLSLSQIASQLGFHDQSNFTKHFRHHTGKTPRRFAQDQRATGIRTTL